MRSKAAAIAAVWTFTILIALFAVANLWDAHDTPGSYFGGDLEAYQRGAVRLMETGTPYHPSLHDGPIANELENVPIAYLYPPPLAQLFTLVSTVPIHTLAIGWITVQAIALLILLPLEHRAGGGALDASSVGMLWGLGFVSFPIQFALFGGNVSGWIAIGVALMLLAPLARPMVAASLALLKITPAALGISLLGSRAEVARAVAVGGLVATISFAIAPTAWLDFLSVLPNILAFPRSTSTGNLSSSAFMSAVGYPALGTLLALGVGGIFGFIAVKQARSGNREASIAAAVAALLLFPASLFDHYLAPMSIVVFFAWPRATGLAKAALGAFIIAGFLLWFPVAHAVAPGFWAVFLVAGAATVHTLARAPEVAFSPTASTDNPDTALVGGSLASER